MSKIRAGLGKASKAINGLKVVFVVSAYALQLLFTSTNEAANLKPVFVFSSLIENVIATRLLLALPGTS
jgi:hypothetical protein